MYHLFKNFKISCIICRGDSNYNQKICQYCQNSFCINISNCLHCGISLPNKKLQYCGKCLQKKSWYFDQIHSAFSYQFPINQIIKKIKDKKYQHIIQPLTQIWTKQLIKNYRNTTFPQIIIPIPLHINQIKKRGFNQSWFIAKALQKTLQKTNIQVRSYLTCSRLTQQQKMLNLNQRKKNVKNAFKCTKKLNIQHVAVVDDIITSGATISEAAKILKKNGVTRVDAWSLAKTYEKF